MSEEETEEICSPSGDKSVVVDAKHYLAKYAFKGGAILQAIRGRFRSPFSDDIVFGKETSLELVTVCEDGSLKTLCEQNAFGIISDIALLRSSDRLLASINKGTDLLAVVSHSSFLAILSFCPEINRFLPLKLVQLSGQDNPRTRLGRMLAADSRGHYLAVCAYEGRIAVLPVSPLPGNNIINKIIYHPSENEWEKQNAKVSSESDICGTIWSMSFISNNSDLGESHDCLLAVVLHRKHRAHNDVVLFGCNIQESTIQIISKFSETETLIHGISEVPRLNGFAILFGMGCIFLLDFKDPSNPHLIQMIALKDSTYDDHVFDESHEDLYVDDEGMSEAAACALLDLKDASVGKYTRDDPMITDSEHAKPKMPARFVSSWCWELNDSIFPKLVFCDDTGDLFILNLSFDSDAPGMSLSDSFHKMSSCKVLLWITREIIVAIQEMGDGMILRMGNGCAECIHIIQNISPLMDLCVVDYYDEAQDQIFACCGMAPEGSLRTIRRGVSVERLLKTAATYKGITGMWALQIKEKSPYHSFLVISFVEETRILTVGLNFVDATEAVGFRADVCTLACGLLSDGILVQIHRTGVRISLPVSHKERENGEVPLSASWYSHNMTINLGAVGPNLIIVATSNPCIIFLLGVHALSTTKYQIYEIQTINFLNEISCISVPKQKLNHGSAVGDTTIPMGFEFNRTFIVGTHKPSVEILSVHHNGDCRTLAIGTITITSHLRIPPSGCIPESVQIVMADSFYVLAGLRNGMLLRYEWPTVIQVPSNGKFHHSGIMPMDVENMDAFFPVPLQLVAFRHIGITPVSLVPLVDSGNSDIIVLSDRPWLLRVARRSLVYESIPFHSATHLTPVSSHDCPWGILFASENSLHLVEVNHSKRLNVEKFPLGGNCRKMLYHEESKTFLVMRCGSIDESCFSDICCVDPRDGSILVRFNFGDGEIAKSMQIIKVGGEQVLVVGTCRKSGELIMPSGESEGSNGRLIVIVLRITGSGIAYDGDQLEKMETEQFQVVASISMPGAVLSICPYLDRYVLASAGSFVCLCTFVNDSPHRLRRLATIKSRFTITCLATHLSRIAAGDCRDGILFYNYEEENKKLELKYSDPVQRLVAQCVPIDEDTVIVSDRKGMISLLTAPFHSKERTDPEWNLRLGGLYNLGETIMTIRKGSVRHELPVGDACKESRDRENTIHSQKISIVCGTMLGNVVTLVPLTSEEHRTLEVIQARLAVHPLTAPILGNNHNELRRPCSTQVVPGMLDGDMLMQFLELTLEQQVQVLGPRADVEASIEEVIWLLERFYYALS